jgi:hypothetical protein
MTDMSRRSWFADLVLLSGLTAMSCAAPGGGGTSPVYLVLMAIEAAPGGLSSGETFRHTLSSDVQTNGRVLSDVGRASFALALKDPGTLALPTRPAPANAVTLERYRVRYVRADGHNVEGVDVPFAFDGAMTVTVGPDGASSTFLLVRSQAKLEPPLSPLRSQGGAVVISTLAEVVFYGRDQMGRAVSAAGRIGVDFGDWADPE